MTKQKRKNARGAAATTVTAEIKTTIVSAEAETKPTEATANDKAVKAKATGVRATNSRAATTDRHAATTATAADNEDRRMETNSRHPLRNPRKSRLAAALCLVAISLLAATCTPGGAFDSDFKTIDAEGWTKSSPLVFLQTDSIRGVDAYDIAVSVRHDNYYPYRNLLLIVDYVAGGKIVEHDTVNVELCDEYGDWGGSGLGKLFQKQMLIKERVPVGHYDKIVVWHNMRVSKVTNVTDVGLTYIKSK